MSELSYSTILLEEAKDQLEMQKELTKWDLEREEAEAKEEHEERIYDLYKEELDNLRFHYGE